MGSSLVEKSLKLLQNLWQFSFSRYRNFGQSWATRVAKGMSSL